MGTVLGGVAVATRFGHETVDRERRQRFEQSRAEEQLVSEVDIRTKEEETATGDQAMDSTSVSGQVAFCVTVNLVAPDQLKLCG